MSRQSTAHAGHRRATALAAARASIEAQVTASALVASVAAHAELHGTPRASEARRTHLVAVRDLAVARA